MRSLSRRTWLPGRSPLLLTQFFLWLGLAYHALASFRSHGALGTFGYCALYFSQLLNGGVRELFQRLSADKASAVSVELLFILWILFVLVILAQVVICFLPPAGPDDQIEVLTVGEM